MLCLMFPGRSTRNVGDHQNDSPPKESRIKSRLRSRGKVNQDKPESEGNDIKVSARKATISSRAKR